MRFCMRLSLRLGLSITKESYFFQVYYIIWAVIVCCAILMTFGSVDIL